MYSAPNVGAEFFWAGQGIQIRRTQLRSPKLQVMAQASRDRTSLQDDRTGGRLE